MTSADSFYSESGYEVCSEKTLHIYEEDKECVIERERERERRERKQKGYEKVFCAGDYD